jgi:cGMP-dependent protein kinase
MVDSGPKNVDGDGEHVAAASTEASPVAQSEGLNTSVKYRGSMMSIDTDDNKHEASPSVEDHEMGNKRPMLKQSMSSKLKGESTRNLGTGGKKKDRGRKAIRAVAADLGYVHKVIPKSDEAKELIYDAIKPNILFRACSIEELHDLVDAFEPQYVPMGSVVIQEGDEGDHFYVMEKGGVDVFEKDVHKCSLYSGVAFGEIALLYSCPRTATVQAKYDCKLWVINRRAFRGITAQHKKRRLELKSDFLKKVKIHDKVLGDILKPSEINSMALATKVQKFKAGNAIVRQGERGDAFYMIEEGKVDVYINEKGARPIVTLQKGSFFGEKALLSSDVRTATCVASTDVKCMLIGREDFVLMLGNLQDLLDRSYIARDEALREKKEAASPYPTTRRFDMNDYEIKRTLGVGAFGFVKLVQWKKAPKGKEDQWYALKCVSKQKIEQHKQQEKIKREEDIMKELIHPFIARLYSGMEDEKGKYFLMEALCGGELCELLYNETQFSERWSLFYSASVLSAFGHMHERKIAYRDLKPENLVLDTFGYVKIVDFGLAKKVKSGQTYTFCGTPDYLAPEVILNEGYDWGVDYWGLGVLIYEMTAGVAPFYAESPMEVRPNAAATALLYI